jgi:hypothetical protein
VNTTGVIVRDSKVPVTISGGPTRPRPRPRSVKRDESDVQLLEHFVDYTVELGTYARKAIVDEIKRAHSAAGEAVETGGWLLGQFRPRADGDSTTVQFVTGPGDGAALRRNHLLLGDPWEALMLVREQWGRDELYVLGDWHAHLIRGSELPSRADVRRWRRAMDRLNGARAAYVSVIVSPSEEMGWMVPRFSAWVGGYHGADQAVFGRATCDY